MVGKVLILTQEQDAHVPPVEEVLRRQNAEIVRFNLSDFPERIQVAAQVNDGWQGTLLYQDQIIMLETIQSAWCRRPQQYRAPQEYSYPVREFLEREAYRGFLGLLLDPSTSAGPFWVSRRDRIQAAELKPAQLAAAQALGLRVPKTLITNDPAAVRSFFHEECQGRMIAKVVSKGVLDPDGLYLSGEARFLHTNVVQPEHLEDLDGVRVTAHLFQELVPKALELRVVVIGRQVFAVEIFSQASERTKVDWRRFYPDLSYGVHQLPQEIEQKLLQLVRQFGLQFSSADFILTPLGDYYFVELNPTGQFLWTAPKTGLPMAEAMANLLHYPKEYQL
jgi:glutathione synthase/RimK-type ligase-like ATP-grasp enzyme